MTPDDPHDVVVVGSGAGGAMAAWMLTKSGATVLMLEAGRDYSPDEAPMLNMAMSRCSASTWVSPRRAASLSASSTAILVRPE